MTRRLGNARSRIAGGMRPSRAWLSPLIASCLLLSTVPAWSAVSATDDAGQVVTLPSPARRIVALGPHITEQLFAVGAGSHIVGTTEYADHPPAAAQIPRVARAHSVDLERVAASRPDLIVVWGSGFPPATIEALRRLGTALYVNEPGALDSIASSMERLGTLTGSTSAAQAASEFRSRIASLREKYEPRAPVRVFYQIWQQPLMTLSGRHVLSEAIRLCGGRNVFDALMPIAPQVSLEAVFAADPQLIATAEPDARPTGALDGWKRFPTIAAVKTGQLVTLDANKLNRHSPRMAEEIGTLCERIDTARRVIAHTPR
jgi:iron complex transport system substrate-binding protein